MAHDKVYFSHPRAYGKGGRKCRKCANHGGLIRRYGIMMCRQCFREQATHMGFVRYR